jgi:acetyl esterase/lipase
MPIGFLITLVIIGACTGAALVRARRWGRPAFLLAVVINEIPHLAALWLVAATALAWGQGDLDGTAGRILATATALVLVGLAELARRDLLARPAVDSTVLAHGARPRHHRWGRLRPLLFPFPWRPRSVVRLGNFAYGDDRRQRLDVYRPRSSDRPGPVLVYFHGGGYFSGGKRREGRALLHRLAARGWTCISAGYRLRPRADFTDHLADARAALRWAHERADVHGGDTRALVMAGSSAGAHLTSLCALTQDASDPDRPRIDAALCLYGYYGRYYGRGEDETPVSTPLALDASQAPPFFIAHGDHDSYASVEDARALQRHLAAGSPRDSWYVELPGAQHGFDALRSWRIAAVIEGIDVFLDRVGIGRAHDGAAYDVPPVAHPQGRTGS